MSDLSMYELEDIIWDDFDRGDDHIVPHPTNAQNSYDLDSCKKPRFETNPVLSNLDASSQKKAENKKKKMMEKESFNPSCNGDGEIMPNFASDDAKMSNNCFNNSYSYPPTQISQKGDVCFVNNSCDNKDLLYYGWSDIGNFEDVDKMLRSCDSSFGLGVTQNDDELGWFTSDALQMDFKFPSSEPCRLKDQKKHQNQMEKKKAEQIDGSFDQISDLIDDKFDQVLTSAGNQNQYRNLELDCYGQMQSNSSFLPPDYPSQTSSSKMRSNFKSDHKGQMNFQPSKSIMVSDVKQARLSGNEIENQSDFKGNKKGAELNVPESCSVSCQLDEISLEATSFCQLRQVMAQLDLGTKICIRDSLYRLAKSAEQRHINPSLSSSATDINHLGGPLLAHRTNKCSGFMDMETDTNPIDRSVAHLLFHRPAESPSNPNLNHGSISGSTEKLVCQEAHAAAGLNDN